MKITLRLTQVSRTEEERDHGYTFDYFFVQEIAGGPAPVSWLPNPLLIRSKDPLVFGEVGSHHTLTLEA